MGLRGPNAHPVQKPKRDSLGAIRRPKGTVHPLGEVTRRYFLDELDWHGAINAMKPESIQWKYNPENYEFQRMFWVTPGIGHSEKEVWLEHRNSLLREFIQRWPGYRPSAWWQHDPERPTDETGRRLHPEDGESQPQFLFNHGLLTESELAIFTVEVDGSDPVSDEVSDGGEK